MQGRYRRVGLKFDRKVDREVVTGRCVLFYCCVSVQEVQRHPWSALLLRLCLDPVETQLQDDGGLPVTCLLPSEEI